MDFRVPPGQEPCVYGEGGGWSSSPVIQTGLPTKGANGWLCDFRCYEFVLTKVLVVPIVKAVISLEKGSAGVNLGWGGGL